MSDIIKTNGYLIDKNGQVAEIVDAAARASAAENAGKIVELSEEMVKTVNGITPDASGNVNLQVTETFVESGQFVAVSGMEEGGAINLLSTADAVTWDRNYKVIHCGENMMDNSALAASSGVNATHDGDGWLVFEVAEAASATTWVNAFYNFPWLLPLSKYRIFYELSAETNVTGTATMYASQNNSDAYFATVIPAITDFSTPGVYAAVVETKAADAIWENMLLSRMSIGFSAGAYGKIKMRPWIVKVDDDTPVSTKFEAVYNASYPGYYGETLALTVPANQAINNEWGEIAAYEGVNTFSATHGVVTASGEKTIEYAATAGAAKLDVTQYKLPLLFLTGTTAGMSKENAIVLKVKFRDVEAWAKFKWQGSSSLAHPKKNYTMTLYTDQACTQPLDVEIVEGWGKHHKYNLKANFMDHTHARNICSCKLWGRIVKSRANVPTELSVLPNGGAIDGFPVIIMLNGEFHGLYTWNIPKDDWMFGSPKAIVCADAHVDATKFKALATLDGDFELEYVEDEDNADWVLPSLNAAIQAVMDGDLATAAQYIDIPSAMDYYIHVVCEGSLDGIDHNYLLVTFDGVKWYFTDYDRDRVYGVSADDTYFFSPFGTVTFESVANTHRLFNLIRTHETAALKARAIALRNGTMSEAGVMDVFVNFMQGIPTQILDEDVRLYPTIPSTNVHNLAQILNWYRLRCIAVDAEINAM